MMDVRVGNDRRRQLLHQLMQQLSGMTRQGMSGGPSMAPGMHPQSSSPSLFMGGAGRGGGPDLTHPDESQGALHTQLGPGGWGQGGYYDQGGAEGAPVPHGPPAVRPGVAPGPGVGGAGPPGPPGPEGVRSTDGPGAFSNVPAYQPPGGGFGGVPTYQPRAGFVPLGNGMYFDPATGAVHGIGNGVGLLK